MTLTASIGFSIFPTDTPQRDQLLSNAKLAMHRGKSKQRGSVCMYSREMDDTARARLRARDRQAMQAVQRLLVVLGVGEVERRDRAQRGLLA